jgi:phosphatidylglycerol:prolipoprotein diacylglycerol transferase
MVDDFLIALFVGMLVGARIIYMLVYYVPSPDSPFRWYTPFAVWEGGLAFHGAVLGMVVAGFWFARCKKVPMLNLTDALALFGSQGIIFGRIGNFINAELFGRSTSGPMGMQFPVRDYNGNLLGWTDPRHPSQLYESVGEGLIPFVLIWIMKPYIKFQGEIGGIWLCLYAVARFIIEFFREKDEQMQYYFGWITMGQILCALMFLCGVVVIAVARWRAVPVFPPKTNTEEESEPAT